MQAQSSENRYTVNKMSRLASEIKGFLAAKNLRLNKDLGQHYLIREDILEDILVAADLEPTDHVVEIGPGIGVLTRLLLAAVDRVTAIEIDDRIIPLLQEFTDNDPKLEIILQNALQTPMPETPYKMVANIPYHITSPLFRHVFLESTTTPKSMTLLIQKEVADRICDHESASLLTIVVGLFGKARMVCPVPPSAFIPPPKVDSAVIHVDCYPKPIADPETIEQIFKYTKIAFSQKRKMLSNTFGTFPGGKELLDAANIDPSRRPQTLSIEEWVAIGKAAQAR